jgi:hypothetical protein
MSTVILPLVPEKEKNQRRDYSKIFMNNKLELTWLTSQNLESLLSERESFEEIEIGFDCKSFFARLFARDHGMLKSHNKILDQFSLCRPESVSPGRRARRFEAAAERRFGP